MSIELNSLVTVVCHEYEYQRRLQELQHVDPNLQQYLRSKCPIYKLWKKFSARLNKYDFAYKSKKMVTH
jgi:hypothetical protein